MNPLLNRAFSEVRIIAGKPSSNHTDRVHENEVIVRSLGVTVSELSHGVVGKSKSPPVPSEIDGRFGSYCYARLHPRYFYEDVTVVGVTNKIFIRGIVFESKSKHFTK